jgi:hypothetical protein
VALGLLIPAASAASLEADDAARRASEANQNTPLVQSLAAHVKKRWALVRDTRTVVEDRLSKCLRQRAGKYDPETLAEIQKQGGSEIYMNLTSVKVRGASSWLRDTLTGTGSEKPWSLDATPIPELPPEVQKGLFDDLHAEVLNHMQTTGEIPQEAEVRQYALQMRDTQLQKVQDAAKLRVSRMELKMEDQLTEGGFANAFSEFIDDIVTFPTAILKGPVPRKRTLLKWDGTMLVPTESIRLEWERVDPFKAYPAPWASSVQDGFFIERHKLTRSDLESLIGVDGYDSAAIKAVLADFDGGMLRNWLSVDSLQAQAENKNAATADTEEIVEAIQLWDEVTGDKLLEWGMPKTDIKDKTKTYPAEVWLIGSRVVRAVLNYDPLGRKPYYASSYEVLPGSFWGNSVPDLIRDCQSMCNASARALSNNMGIASGPQVGVNISRLPAGEQITNMYPWKTWQFQNSDYQDNSKPLEFFQPTSNAPELMAVFEKFSTMADEYSGIPRYMTGESTSGAGRTASGLSMMMSNASKGLKQVVHNIDSRCLTPMLERLYQHNLRYSKDPELVGDVTIVAKGAVSLVLRETTAVRRNEFLQLVLNSPIAQQVVGLPGAAALLRDAAKQLDMPADKVVPSEQSIAQMIADQRAQQQAALQQSMQPEYEKIDFQKDASGAVTGATKMKPKGMLPDGSPAGGRDANIVRNRVQGG